jgi:hypothetical protein
MRRRLVFVRFLVLSVAAIVGGGAWTACGSSITSRQINEPCTRTSQCDDGLVCLTGVCQLDPDSGAGGAAGSSSGS